MPHFVQSAAVIAATRKRPEDVPKCQRPPESVSRLVVDGITPAPPAVTSPNAATAAMSAVVVATRRSRMVTVPFRTSEVVRHRLSGRGARWAFPRLADPLFGVRVYRDPTRPTLWVMRVPHRPTPARRRDRS